MSKLNAFGLGILLGLILILLKVTAEADAGVAREKTIMDIVDTMQVVKLSVAQQAKIDEEIKFNEWLEKQNDIPYSFLDLEDKYQIYLAHRCMDFDIDFFIAASLMFSESSFNPDAVSKDGRDIGLMQIRDVNWKYLYDHYGLDAKDEYENIDCGLVMLSRLMKKYPIEEAIQCYKCGEYGGVKLWNEGYRHSSIDEILTRADEWRDMADGNKIREFSK